MENNEDTIDSNLTLSNDYKENNVPNNNNNNTQNIGNNNFSTNPNNSNPSNKYDYSLPGIIHFLEHQWTQFEFERAQWESEKAELHAKIAISSGERKGQENVKKDLIRRVKMLEYALIQERLKTAPTSTNLNSIADQYDADQTKDLVEIIESLNERRKNNQLKAFNIAQPDEHDLPQVNENKGERATMFTQHSQGTALLQQYLREIGFIDNVIESRALSARKLLGLSNAQSGISPYYYDGNNKENNNYDAYDDNNKNFDRINSAQNQEKENKKENQRLANIYHGNYSLKDNIQPKYNISTTSQGGNDNQKQYISTSPNKNEAISKLGAAKVNFSHRNNLSYQVEDKYGINSNYEQHSNEMLDDKTTEALEQFDFLSNISPTHEDNHINDNGNNVENNDELVNQDSIMMQSNNYTDKKCAERIFNSTNAPINNTDVLKNDLEMIGGTENINNYNITSDYNDSEEKGAKSWHIRCSLRGHLDAIRSIAFHPNLPCILTASEDQTIKYWCLDPTFQLPHHNTSLNNNNNGNGNTNDKSHKLNFNSYYATNKKSNAFNELESIATFRYHEAPILAISFDDTIIDSTLETDDTYFFSGSLDGMLVCWKVPPFYNMGSSKTDSTCWDQYEGDTSWESYINSPTIPISAITLPNNPKVNENHPIWGIKVVTIKNHEETDKNKDKVVIALCANGNLILWNPFMTKPNNGKENNMGLNINDNDPIKNSNKDFKNDIENETGSPLLIPKTTDENGKIEDEGIVLNVSTGQILANLEPCSLLPQKFDSEQIADIRGTCLETLPYENHKEKIIASFYVTEKLVNDTDKPLQYNCLSLFDVATQKCVTSYKTETESKILSLACHPTLHILVTGHEDKRVRFFDIFKGSLLNTMNAHLDAVSCLTLDPYGLYLLTGSHDNSIRLWDFKERICLQEIPCHRKKFDESIHAIAMHSTLSYMATAGADAIAKIFVLL